MNSPRYLPWVLDADRACSSLSLRSRPLPSVPRVLSQPALVDCILHPKEASARKPARREVSTTSSAHAEKTCLDAQAGKQHHHPVPVSKSVSHLALSLNW